MLWNSTICKGTIRSPVRRSLVPVLLLAAALASGEPVSAATITVDEAADEVDPFGNGRCSLREAIMSANGIHFADCLVGDPGVDTIVVPAGTYVLTRPGIGEDLGHDGDLDLIDDVVIQGAGSDLTVIDANGLDRVFHVADGTTAHIYDLTIRNGRVDSDVGGGVRNEGNLTLTDSTVVGNEAGGSVGGGGIYSHGTLSLVNTAVTGNLALSSGGGLAILGGVPGGFFALTAIESSVSGNLSGSNGGGIAHIDGVVTLINSTVSGNVSALDGGGIGMTGPFNRDLVLSNSTVSGNLALGSGGAIQTLVYITASVTLVNSTLSGNLAGSAGDAIANAGGATVTLQNSVLDGHCTGSSFSSDGGNLESPGDTCGLSHPTDQASVDAVQLNLGPLADNGGPNLTHAPLPGSVAIDAAINALCPGEDQRGVPRPLDGDGDTVAQCDIGAVEVTQCGDGIDNDGDSQIDFGNDPQCIGFTDNSEACGLGPELALLLPGLMRMQRSRRAAA